MLTYDVYLPFNGRIHRNGRIQRMYTFWNTIYCIALTVKLAFYFQSLINNTPKSKSPLLQAVGMDARLNSPKLLKI